MNRRDTNNRAARGRAPGANRRHGFTLIEAAMATVIIGVGVMAMLQLLAAGTVSNTDGAALTTGVNLAKHIRELTVQKSMAEVVALDGAVYDPPHDSRDEKLDALAGWQQTIDVTAVEPDRLTREIVDDTPAAVRVTVTVAHNGRTVAEMSWFRFDPTQ